MVWTWQLVWCNHGVTAILSNSLPIQTCTQKTCYVVKRHLTLAADGA